MSRELLKEQVLKEMISIAVIMTCFNRKELTSRCLDSLRKSELGQNNYKLDYYVVDDSCTDGTTELLDEKYRFINHLKGNGQLYWNGGMYCAFKQAILSYHDFYLWVNDDVIFFDGVVNALLDLYKRISDKPCIISGYTLSVDKKTITYGGQRLAKGLVPLNLINIIPSGDKIEKCDSMHGNCVLIPNEVVKRIGIIDPFYTHSFGDVDYGLRASRAGMAIYVSDFPVGVCEKNPRSDRKDTFKDKGFVERFKIMNSFRHRPLKDWVHFTRKFGGRLWFLRFIAPYVKLAINKYE